MVRSIPSGRAMIDKETVHIQDDMVQGLRAEFSVVLTPARSELH